MRVVDRREFGVWTCAGMTASLLGIPRPLLAEQPVTMAKPWETEPSRIGSTAKSATAEGQVHNTSAQMPSRKPESVDPGVRDTSVQPPTTEPEMAKKVGDASARSSARARNP